MFADAIKRHDVGVTELREDARLAAEPRHPLLPARELLGDLLLELNDPVQAMQEFETSMQKEPNRFNGLYGAAQAAEMTQQKEKAAGYYAQLLKNCDGVRSDRPELAQAKTLLAAK